MFNIIHIWEFPKVRGAVLWGPYNKDPTFFGTILGPPPHFRKLTNSEAFDPFSLGLALT